VISVLKRTYGATVSSRVWWRQFRELVAMCLVYKVERAVKLGVTLLDWLWFHLLYFFQQRISTEPQIIIKKYGFPDAGEVYCERTEASTPVLEAEKCLT
jgi:hypothetical protein